MGIRVEKNMTTLPSQLILELPLFFYIHYEILHIILG